MKIANLRFAMVVFLHLYAIKMKNFNMVQARKNPRKDGNHTEVIKGLRDYGATVLDISAVPKGTDILVGFNGILHIMEIKNPNQPPSQIKLTPGELECKSNFERVNVEYNVVLHVKDALDIIDPTRQGEKPTDRNKLILKVCEIMEVSFNDVMGESQLPEVCHARHLAMFLIYFKHDSATLKKVGGYFNKGNGSTRHAIRATKKRIATDRDFRKKYEKLKDL